MSELRLPENLPPIGSLWRGVLNAEDCEVTRHTPSALVEVRWAAGDSNRHCPGAFVPGHGSFIPRDDAARAHARRAAEIWDAIRRAAEILDAMVHERPKR